MNPEELQKSAEDREWSRLATASVNSLEEYEAWVREVLALYEMPALPVDGGIALTLNNSTG